MTTTMTIPTARRRTAPARVRCAYAVTAPARTSEIRTSEVRTSEVRTSQIRTAGAPSRPRGAVRPVPPVAGRARRANQDDSLPRSVAAPRLAPTSRLTRRGRLAVSCAALVAVVAALAAGVTLLDSGQVAASSSTSGPVLTTVTVEPGDTLWDIARDIAPGTDPRDMVSRLRDLNDISGGLASGQELVVPVTG